MSESIPLPAVAILILIMPYFSSWAH
jgi:hypothetical protein